MIIGIVGNGYVGGATRLFGCKDNYADVEDNTVITYDIDPKKCIPTDTKLDDLKVCDLVFVCVPTPEDKDGSCDTSMVEEVVNSLPVDNSRIFIRSTVPVGTSKKLGVNYMPEFLTERNWEKDVYNCENWIVGLLLLGGALGTRLKTLVRKMFITAKRNGKIKNANLVFCSTDEAETVKAIRNNFLAVKVSFFNEMEEFCRKQKINYNSVVEMVRLDKRIGSSHTQVPGPDGKRGFGGTCFPKDTKSLYSQMLSVGMEGYILPSAIFRNECIDRKEKKPRKKKSTKK